MHTTLHDPRHARVPVGQPLLFPLSARQVCEETGLNWWAAAKLHAEGWLSFDPDQVAELDDAQEQELRFVGSLIAAGCGPGLLEHLLRDLDRPYRYRGRRIYYDWAERRWRLLPERDPGPAEVFAEWLEGLCQARDEDQLRTILAEVEEAIESLQEEQ